MSEDRRLKIEAPGTLFRLRSLDLQLPIFAPQSSIFSPSSPLRHHIQGIGARQLGPHTLDQLAALFFLLRLLLLLVRGAAPVVVALGLAVFPGGLLDVQFLDAHTAGFERRFELAEAVAQHAGGFIIRRLELGGHSSFAQTHRNLQRTKPRRFKTQLHRAAPGHQLTGYAGDNFWMVVFDEPRLRGGGSNSGRL